MEISGKIGQAAYLESEEALREMVAAFELGTFPGSEWKHREHVAVAAYYLYGFADAEARMRRNVAAYNESQGGLNTADSGYHETLTVFWMRLIGSQLDRGAECLEAVRDAVERFGTRRDLFRHYYDFDVLRSPEARSRWIPPTCKTL